MTNAQTGNLYLCFVHLGTDFVWPEVLVSSFFFAARCSKPYPWISRCFYVTTSAAEVLSDVVLSQSCPPGRTTRAVSTLKLVWYLKHDRLTTKQHAGTQLYFQLLDSHLEIQKIRNKKLTENNGFTLFTNNELSLHGCIAAFWMQCCQMLDPRFYLIPCINAHKPFTCNSCIHMPIFNCLWKQILIYYGLH